MQVLVKITVVLSQPTDRDSANTILTKHGFTPVWYIVLGDVCATMLFSMNTELYGNDYSTAFFEMFGVDGETLKALTEKTDIGLIPLDFNCPATVTQTTNGNVTTTVSQQSYTEGEGTWTYTTTGTFNTSTGINTLTSSATYSDEKVTQTTVMNVDHETGEGVITTTTTNNETGQVTEQSNYYDENGELTNTHIEKTNTDNSHQSTDIVYNGDGSSSSQTREYDSNDTLVSGNNQYTDTLGNQNTQSLEYNSNGVGEVVGYNINTEGNTTGNGESIEGQLDTGFIAFNGKKFIISADVEFSTTEQGGNPCKTLISALELIPSNNKYKGFFIRNGGGVTEGNTPSAGQIYAISLRASNAGFTMYSNGNGGYSVQSTYPKLFKARYRYQFQIEYTPRTSSGYIEFKIKPTSTNGTTVSSTSWTTLSGNSSYLPPTMETAKITIGGNAVSDNFNMSNLTVYSFNVQKVITF